MKIFDQFIKDLKARFDVIILDTPPVGLVTDGILAMQKSDIPIYVMRAEYSRKNFVKSISKLISHNQFHNLSVVLNGVRTNGRYGYGYGYEQAYGQEESETSIFRKFFKKAT